MKRCLFCDATRLTAEHIFPDWLVRLFQERMKGRQGDFKASLDQWDGTRKDWRQSTITQKKRLMCGDCNNVKLGSVERQCKDTLVPFIEDGFSSRSIDRADQLILSTWFLVRSMVWDGIAPHDHRYFTQLQRATFSDSNPLRFPPNTHIWLGLYRGPRRATFKAVNHLASDDDGFHVVTAVINHAVLQIATWKGDGWWLNRAAFRRAEWHLALKQIWPTRRVPVQWPPAYLENKSLQALSQRFGGNSPINLA